MRFRRSDGQDDLVDPNTGVVVEGEDESSGRPSNDGQNTEVVAGNARLRGMLRRVVMAIRVKRMFEGGRRPVQDVEPRRVSCGESDSSDAEHKLDAQQPCSHPTSLPSRQGSSSEKGREVSIDTEVNHEASCSSRGGQGGSSLLEIPASSTNSLVNTAPQSATSDTTIESASIPFPEAFLSSDQGRQIYGGEYPWSVYVDSVRSSREWTNYASPTGPYQAVDQQIRGSQLANSTENYTGGDSHGLPQNTINLHEISPPSPYVDRNVWPSIGLDSAMQRGTHTSSNLCSNDWAVGGSAQQTPRIFRSDVDGLPGNSFLGTETGLESSIWVEGCGFVPINQFQEQAQYHMTPGFDSNGHWHPGGSQNGSPTMTYHRQCQGTVDQSPYSERCEAVDEPHSLMEPATRSSPSHPSPSETSGDAKSISASSGKGEEDVRQQLQTQLSVSMTDMRSLSRSLSVSNLKAPRSKSAYTMARPSLQRQSTGTHRRRFKNMFSMRRKRTSSSSSEMFHGYPLDSKSEPCATDEPLICPVLPANLVEYSPQLERPSLTTPSFGSTVSESSFSITSSLSTHSIALNASCPELGRTSNELPSRSMMSDSQRILRSSEPEALWLQEKPDPEAFGTVEEELPKGFTIPTGRSSPERPSSSQDQDQGGTLVETLIEKLCAMNEEVVKEVVVRLLSRADPEKLVSLMNEHSVEYKER